MSKDSYYLKKALNLAKLAEGFTSPNPLVGAVLVKGKKVIAKAYHRGAGFPHAEAKTLKSFKGDLKGATFYINLEPCCHFGRTPPCVDEIIKRGIKRVVISTLDPNPKVNGKSVAKLKKAGIKVQVGLYREEALKLNEVFFKNIKTKTPFVVAKIAQSLDGKIATYKGISKWITSEPARKFVKSLRNKYDSVLIGANTFKKDNPHLDGLKKIPYKIVISSNLKLPLNSYLFKNNPEKLIIFTSQRAKIRAKKIPSRVRIFFLKDNKGWLSLPKILKILYKINITSVFIEGGAKTLGRFFSKELVDKALFFISPKIIGGEGALSSIGAKGSAIPGRSPCLKNIEINKVGEDLFIQGYPDYCKK